MENLNNEVWRNIDEYDNYQVSNLGRVKSLNYNHTGKEKILKPAKSRNGYLAVCLCKNGKCKQFKIHRLVAKAFIPNPNNLPECNHRNEIKTENCVDNLEWCSKQYNINYGTGTKRSAKKRTNGKRSKPVLQYDQDGNFIKEWPSANEVERQLGFGNGNISACCLGKYKQAYGYIWHYKKKEVA